MTRRGKYSGKFEQEWQEAFDAYEHKPSGVVWSNIDSKLAYAELAAVKKKAAWYRWASAAILLLACSLGLFQYLNYQQQLNERRFSGIVVADRPAEPTEWNFALPDFLLVDDEDKATSIPEATGSGLAFLKSETENKSSFANQSAYVEQSSIEAFEVAPLSINLGSNRQIAALSDHKELYYLPVYANGQRKKASQNDIKFFAGVDVGGGNFEPNYSSQGVATLNSSLAINPSAFSLASNEAIDQTSPSVREGMTGGETVSLGFNFGINLGKKWVLESGLNYAMSAATTKTNVVVQSSRYQEGIAVTQQVKGIAQIENVVAREQVIEYDYRDVNLDNQFQFATVPLQAGYYLIDQKFKLKINAGLAANFYLGNRLSTKDESIAEVTLGPGDDSPYKELSFSGLAGVEVGYNVLKNFDIIVEPNYQQSLNDLTKENATFTASPSGFSVMTGIRYNFN